MTGKVFDTKKRYNIKRKAKYRLINKYTKSLLQYKKEEARRRRVFELWSRGYTVTQIAAELHTSSRTVNRVRKELSPKIERQFQRSLDCLVEEARLAVLTPLNGLSISRQTLLINEYFVKQHGLLKRRRKT